MVAIAMTMVAIAMTMVAIAMTMVASVMTLVASVMTMVAIAMTMVAIAMTMVAIAMTMVAIAMTMVAIAMTMVARVTTLVARVMTRARSIATMRHRFGCSVELSNAVGTVRDPPGPLLCARRCVTSTLSPMTSAAPYQLSVDGFASDAFRVHSFTGKEAMSEAWSFDVVATADAGGDVVEQTALGQRATLLFNVGESQRAFYGIVAAVRLARGPPASTARSSTPSASSRASGCSEAQEAHAHLPEDARARHRLRACLLEAGIATRWQLMRAYPAREYCTQYEETDYHFVTPHPGRGGHLLLLLRRRPASTARPSRRTRPSGAAAAVGERGRRLRRRPGRRARSWAPPRRWPRRSIPGDTVVGADDATLLSAGRAATIRAALAASTAAAMAPAVGDALGAGGRASRARRSARRRPSPAR